MVRTVLVVVALAAASRSAAQAQQPQPYPPQQQQPQGQAQPSQPAQPAQPSSPSTAGSQGQSSTAQPSSPGASSQQVVVNPPSSEQPTTAPPPPPSSTTVVNPPPYRGDTVVVEERYRPNPFATVATDAAWGGLAGLLVGFGITLVDEFDDWDRDLMVGAGIGVLAGAAVGVAHAAYEAREADRARRRVAYGDGMNRTDRDPVVTARTFGFALRF